MEREGDLETARRIYEKQLASHTGNLWRKPY